MDLALQILFKIQDETDKQYKKDALFMEAPKLSYVSIFKEEEEVFGFSFGLKCSQKILTRLPQKVAHNQD